VFPGQLVVVDAEDDGEVGTIGRGRDNDALGAGGQVRRGLVAGGEDARAFERDIDAEFAVRQGRRVLDRGHLDRLAAADDDRVAADFDACRELAVDRVVTQQVCVGLDRAEVVDGNDLDIGAAGFDDCSQHVAADAAETVDGNLDSHFTYSAFSLSW
jgi:hypothetical protein